MDLKRRGDGVVLLGDTPVRRWFRNNSVTPVQESYRGHKDGMPCMCLLTAMTFHHLDGSFLKLHTLMDRIGLCRGEEPDPNYRRMEQILADALGLDRRDAKALESGWTECVLDRAVMEARRESRGLSLWDLGQDAWRQASAIARSKQTP